MLLRSRPAGAPAVLLVHGTGTWSEIWRETIDALSSDHRVIAIDLPHFGYSDKPLGALAYTRPAQARRLIRVLDALKLTGDAALAGRAAARPDSALAPHVIPSVSRGIRGSGGAARLVRRAPPAQVPR